MSKTKELTDSNFDEIVKNQEKPVLVEFYAPWCGHCRTQTPIIEDLAQEIEDDAVIAKMNVDENPQKLTVKEVVDGTGALFKELFK